MIKLNNKESITEIQNIINLQKTIIDNFPVLLYNVSSDGIILDCNKIVLNTLGYKNKNELIGKPLLTTIYASSSLKKAKTLFLKWQKTGNIKNEELQIKTKNGRIIDVLLNVHILNDNDGRVLSSISTQFDITKLKRIKNKVLDLAKFPSENPNPVFRVNNKLKIIYSNKTAKKILRKLGLKKQNIPKALSDSLKSSIKKNGNDLMTLVLDIDKSIYEFIIIPVKDTNYFNIYGNDITEKKRAEKLLLMREKEKISVDERDHLAKELHDTVTQTLFSANLIAEVIPKLWKKNPKIAIKKLEEVRLLNNTALAEMRVLLFELKSLSFKNEKLGNLLKGLVKSISVRSGIPISVQVDDKYKHSPKVELGFYRIAQEALNNVAKHSNATDASLLFESYSGYLKLLISDNGDGFDSKKIDPWNLGLTIMKERAKLMGASIDISAKPGRGTEISIAYTR